MATATDEGSGAMRPHLDRLKQEESARKSAEKRYDELLDDVDDLSDALYEKVGAAADGLTELDLFAESDALRAASELATAPASLTHAVENRRTRSRTRGSRVKKKAPRPGA